MNRSVLTLTLVLGIATLAFAAPEKVKEAVTGKEFDKTVSGAEKGRTLTCVGTACREKTWVAVDVYAVALWVDAGKLKSDLSKWKGKSGKDVAGDQAFFDSLCKADVEKRLRLVFVRSVGAQKIRDAFKESLASSYETLPKAATDFLALFTQDLNTGDSIELRSLPGGVIEAYQNNKLLKTFGKDPSFAAAVWKIWFQKEVADEYLEIVKKNLVSDLSRIW
jgi:hypothetical protein